MRLWALSCMYANWCKIALQHAVNGGGTRIACSFAGGGVVGRSVSRRRDRRLHRLRCQTDATWTNIDVRARSRHLRRGARLAFAKRLTDDGALVRRTTMATRNGASTHAEPATDNTIAIERIDEPHAPAAAPGGPHYFLVHPRVE